MLPSTAYKILLPLKLPSAVLNKLLLSVPDVLLLPAVTVLAVNVNDVLPDKLPVLAGVNTTALLTEAPLFK